MRHKIAEIERNIKLYDYNYFWLAIHWFIGCPVQSCVRVKTILKKPMVQCKCGRIWEL